MSIDYGKLRTKAKAIVVIPKHYRLEMEDNTHDEKERSFIWEDPGKDDCQFEITLDIETGHLIRLDIDMEAKDSVDQDSSAEEARAIADAFLVKHTPDYGTFTWVNIEEQRNLRFITYREEVGGLPLPDTGCDITMDNGLNVIRYQLERSRQKATPKPKWPSIIVDVETVRQQVLRELRMELTIVTLYPSMYEMEGTEPEYRLVYEPIPGHRLIDAITGVDLFGLEHYVMSPSHPIAPITSGETLTFGKQLKLDDLRAGSIKDIATLEIELGIDPELYVLEKSKDDGERIGMLYKFREEVDEGLEPEALSVDAYMKRKWGDSLNLEASFKIQIEKSTGRLVGFYRNEQEKEAVPSLNRKQCWEKAEQFLRRVFPDYTSYLQIEVDQEDTDRQPREREFFHLPVYIGNIPVNHERVTLNVSTSTGKICVYMGVSYEMIRELEERNFPYPTLTPEKAFDRYSEYVRFRLRWFKDLEDEDLPVYRLLYEPTTTRRDEFPLGAGRNRGLRYIDAYNGEPIWERI
ncbi:MAG: YcdB/YcdC domain-containing protein [Desulfitobacteriaceae bacterium]